MADPESMQDGIHERSGVLAWSRFAQRLVAAQPALAAELDPARRWDAAAMRAFLAHAAPRDEQALGRSLRELRARVMLSTLARDLAGLADLAEVMNAMSDLAEVALAAALSAVTATFESEFGVPSTNGVHQSLLVVGMGKLGGRELNVSSDIDLIFVYPEEGELAQGRGGTLSHHEFFARLSRRLIALIDAADAGGRVFRVDMRLRPWGEAGPIATSFGALEQYFIAHGREWERYAWIKGRVVAGGSAQQVAALTQLVRPFVYRKYLDYGSIAAVRSLHAQIRQEVARRDLADHIKLGPGGIREIEFIAQAHQLIRGGRDSALQARATLEVLQLLATRGLIAAAVASELATAYVFLRRLEHRLQYLDDAQTHVLPQNANDRALIAQAMNARDWESFLATLDTHRANVTRLFDEVFARPGPDSSTPQETVDALASVWQGNLDPERAAAVLTAHGYADGAEAFARLQQLRASSRYRELPAASRLRLDELAPQLVAAAARTAQPDITLARAITFVETISRRAAYLALLHEQPQALAKVAELLASSSWAADYLTRHPILLDELLDPRLLASAPDWDAFTAELRRAMEAHEGDVERQMSVMRELHHGQLFRLLSQDLVGLLTVERLADHLSLAADLVLAVALETCWKVLRTRHRETPRFAVIAYGKLGGKELGYASDLDLVFLFDDDAEAAPENYTRLAQRLNTWLASTTPSGVLFDTDLRLRPNGEAGLPVVSMAAFRKYQLGAAWSWEHQALTRARFCAGDAALGALFEALRRDILTTKRDPAVLARDVLAMRRKMADAHPNASAWFDLKHDRGGMIDIEFVVQYLVLAHAAHHPELTGNLGNIALLHMAGALGLVPAALAARVADAYREYRHLQHRLRLNGAAYARVERASVAGHIEATIQLWDFVFAAVGPA